MTKNKRHILFIEYIRLIALLCVIFFHAMGMLVNRPNLSHISMLRPLMTASGYLVGVAVPLFFFISGYLYKRPEKGKYLPFLKKKALRLLLPYPIFTALTMLASGFFDYHHLLSGGFWHLWFLTALFWCFVVSLMIDYESRYIYVLLPLGLAMMMIKLPTFVGLQDFVPWFYYFAMGAIVKKHDLTQTFNHSVILGFLLVYVVINILFPFHYRERSVIHAIAISAIIMVIWTLIQKVQVKKIGFVSSLGQQSMGIYILHYMVLIFVLSSTSYRIFHVMGALQTCPILTITAIVVITLATCYVITLLFNSNRWTRYLIGG